MHSYRLAFLTVLAFLAAPIEPELVGDESPARTIKVSAQSELKVVPDQIVLDLAVSTEDRELLQSKAENDKKAAAVLSLAKKYKIASENFQSSNLEVEPQYNNYRRDASTLTGYKFIRSFEIRVHDFSKLEPLLSDAIKSGVNHVKGMYFRTTKHREHQFEARRLAVLFAKEKATHLAELNDLKVGKAIHIEESVEGNWYTGGFGGGVAALSSPHRSPVLASRPRLSGSKNVSAITHKQQIRFVSFNQAEQASGKKQPKKPRPVKEQVQVPEAPGHMLIKATVTITFELHEED